MDGHGCSRERERAGRGKGFLTAKGAKRRRQRSEFCHRAEPEFEQEGTEFRMSETAGKRRWIRSVIGTKDRRGRRAEFF